MFGGRFRYVVRCGAYVVTYSQMFSDELDDFLWDHWSTILHVSSFLVILSLFFFIILAKNPKKRFFFLLKISIYLFLLSSFVWYFWDSFFWQIPQIFSFTRFKENVYIFFTYPTPLFSREFKWLNKNIYNYPTLEVDLFNSLLDIDCYPNKLYLTFFEFFI